MKGRLKSVILVVRTSPFNTIVLPEAMRMGVGLTVCDNSVNILLIDDGVWNVLRLAPHIIGRPDISESMELFQACGVRVFADEMSLKERDITECRSDIEKVSREDAYKLIADSDVVISFR